MSLLEKNYVIRCSKCSKNIVKTRTILGLFSKTIYNIMAYKKNMRPESKVYQHYERNHLEESSFEEFFEDYFKTCKKNRGN